MLFRHYSAVWQILWLVKSQRRRHSLFQASSQPLSGFIRAVISAAILMSHKMLVETLEAGQFAWRVAGLLLG